MFPNSLSFEAGLQQALDIRPPWSVCEAKFDRSGQQTRIALRHSGPYACPGCGAAASAPRPRFLYALPARCVNAEAAALFAAELEWGLRRILAAMLATCFPVTSEFLLAVLLGRWANSAAAADFSALLE